MRTPQFGPARDQCRAHPRGSLPCSASHLLLPTRHASRPHPALPTMCQRRQAARPRGGGHALPRAAAAAARALRAGAPPPQRAARAAQGGRAVRGGAARRAALHRAALYQVQRRAARHLGQGALPHAGASTPLFTLLRFFTPPQCSCPLLLTSPPPSTSQMQTMERLCLGNKYTTTLHVINSAIVKLGKLMPAQKVHRHGQSGRLGEATAGLHGLIRLHLTAWGCPLHS